MDDITGSGAAGDATIDTTGSGSTVSDQKRAQDEIASLRAKVERQREHLAGAEAALSAAEARLAEEVN